MEAIWDSMNIASRVGKQIENMDSLVPKAQAGTVTVVADLQELLSTINSVRTTLVPFVTSSKKSKVVSDPSFDICIKGIKESLNELYAYFKDLEKEFSVYTWKTQKVKLYRLDFGLKQRLDQFTTLFNPDEVKDSKRGGKDQKPQGATIIADPEGRDMWIKSFGESTLMVPWNVFLTTIESQLSTPLKEDEEYVKDIIDFTRTDHVSCYEFSVFLKWFGPLKGSTQRLLQSIHDGLVCGFVPAVEANLLLEGKRDGTYLIRCSKTQPGCFAVTFVDSMQKVKHCLLYSMHPHGLSLKNPPTVYASLKEFADSHTNKLKHPLGNKYTKRKRLQGFEFDGKVANGPETKSEEGNVVEGNQCIVCMDNPLETVFLECGHLACCMRCSDKLKLCPICRNPIARVVPIFRAT